MKQGTTSFIYVTYILSTPDKVFDAITKPEVARAYWGHENVSDWKVGSDWLHIRADAERNVQLAGKVIESAPPHRLVISWANESQKDDPSKTSRVTFDIEPLGALVRLTVSHDELESGGGMEKGIRRGWPLVLSSLKSFLETGRPIDVLAVPKPA